MNCKTLLEFINKRWFVILFSFNLLKEEIDIFIIINIKNYSFYFLYENIIYIPSLFYNLF
jgi:hypothetical protein